LPTIRRDSEEAGKLFACGAGLMAVVFSLALLSACRPRIPGGALRLDAESLRQRQVQTRVFQTEDEGTVLAACAALLQDLGFNIDESEARLGVIVASKDRSAVNAGQIVGSILLSALTGQPVPWDKNQKMRASVITTPVGEKRKSVAVRVTFQRIVWNTNNQVTRREGLTDPEIYQEFFDKLSKSLFLEAQEVL
jgi:hypothetical protein